MKIRIAAPGSPYHSEVDTGANDVTITECYIGAGFVTADGEHLGVSMRDAGFELLYAGQHWRFSGGVVDRLDGDG